MTAWECPFGKEPPKRGSTLTPVRTVVSTREPHCPFCGRDFKEEFRIAEIVRGGTPAP